MLNADSLDAIQQAVQEDSTIICRGGGTKTALSQNATLDLAQLKGVVQYTPSEYTFTALAGTPLKDVRDELAENRQFMPFDPPMVNAGATLGGTVAAGLSGSGRFRYGGIRDFLLGVKLVTRSGSVVFGGSKVVKNAAGFDIPKLMCGSLGRMGILAEVTFKVFPLPEEFRTVRIDCGDLQHALPALKTLSRLPLDLTALDLEPSGQLVLRMGGTTLALPDRVERIRKTLEYEVTDVPSDQEYWEQINDFQWLPSQHSLVKIPLSPTQISDAENFFGRMNNSIPRRYAVAGNLLWIGWPRGESNSVLEGLSSTLKRQALTITGEWNAPHDELAQNRFGKRIESVFLGC